MTRLLNPLFIFILLIQILFLQTLAYGNSSRPSRHHLTLNLNPKLGTAEIKDKITLYPTQVEKNSIEFLLHADFKIKKTEIPHKGEWSVKIEKIKGPSLPLNRIYINKPKDIPWPSFLEIHFNYSGKLFDPLAKEIEPNSSNSSGKSTETLFLSGASYFYPQLITESEKALITFSLEVNTPKSWKVVSQGKRIKETTVNGPRHTYWQCDDPMEEIFIIADQYHEFKDKYEDINLYVFLRDKDKSLAEKYFKAAKKYIPYYESIFGSYPYVKFAVIENSRQTGFGMPSFTLLGSQVIRFPFILHTSFPHEILHNWWGNGVYVNPQGGNWSEGLTAYFSDHLFPQIKGQGDRYRFQELTKYLNYVTPENDFPLNEFRSRTNMTSQSIGYGKWLMILNMLRLKIGTPVFLKSLEDFYLTYRFKHAGFDQLQSIFEKHFGSSLNSFFNQWIKLKGGPHWELEDATIESIDQQYRLQLNITQKQAKPYFSAILPVAIWYKQNIEPEIIEVQLKALERQVVSLNASQKPMAILIDPYYDLFRKLDRKEVPPSISQTYGNPKALVIAPHKEEPELKIAYRTFAADLGLKNNIQPEQLFSWDTHTTLWVFGKNNGVAHHLLPQLKKYFVEVDDKAISIEGNSYPIENHSYVFTLPHPQSPENSITWVFTDSVKSVPGLMRKLPHYGKFGYMVFKGSEPKNILKGTWPADRVGLMKKFQAGNYPIPKRKPIISFSPPKDSPKNSAIDSKRQ